MAGWLSRHRDSLTSWQQTAESNICVSDVGCRPRLNTMKSATHQSCIITNSYNVNTVIITWDSLHEFIFNAISITVKHAHQHGHQLSINILLTVSAELHYTDTGSEHHQRTPPTDELTTNSPPTDQKFATSQHLDIVEMLGSRIAMWQICCRIVVSSSVGGVRTP